MKTFSALIAVLASLGWVAGADAQNDGDVRLRYSLTEGSNIVLFKPARPPTFERSLSGTFDVIVRERSARGFVMEIVDLKFRSVEDDRYEVIGDNGFITFDQPEIDLILQLEVNGIDDVYEPAMTGPNRDILATTWPPVFRKLVLIGADRRNPYWLQVWAEAPSCPADCNQDGTATLDELLMCLNIALGLATSDSCPMCDVNGDGGVSIDEVVTSVDAVLNGCFE